MNDKPIRERILDAAEIRARRGGYNAFSFRELADDVGVKSASVHYHFPTKPELAEALARRYAERAKAWLGDPEARTGDEAVARVTTMFRDALVKEDQMCLCGVFGAEKDGLPDTVNKAVAEFFQMLLQYLREASRGAAMEAPETVVARLEGALILARSLGDKNLFETIVNPA